MHPSGDHQGPPAYVWISPGRREHLRESITAELHLLGYSPQWPDPGRAANPLAAVAHVLPDGSLALVDVSESDPETALRLGEARALQGTTAPDLMIAMIGEREPRFRSTVPEIPFARYDEDSFSSVRSAVRDADFRARASAPPQPTPPELRTIAENVPRSVQEVVEDPVLGLAVTLYVLRTGSIAGEELAATIGFPPFPTFAELAPHVRELFHAEYDDFCEHWIARTDSFLDELRRRLSLDRAGRAPSPLQDGNDSGGDTLFATALLHREEDPGTRNAEQTAALLQTLSEITDLSRHEAQDLPLWESGLDAVSRIARLVVSQVLPSDLRTVHLLRAGDPSLRMIATLGGALFLRSSVEILARTDIDSRYTALGLRLAELTDGWGGQAGILHAAAESEAVTQHIEGLRQFARRSGTIFMMEHPFHFRVLLEVLSGENRRYPAEPILNVQALRRIWTEDVLVDTFCWSRNQLPIVVNELRQKNRNVAFVQHYAAFGRTPMTSSFARLSYQLRSAVRPAKTAWWPRAFDRIRSTDLRNCPNTVVEVYATVRRQQRVARLWGGTSAEDDLRWLCAEIMAWDGSPVLDGNLADRIWDTTSWVDQGFVVDALAEVRTGTWLLETLRRRQYETPFAAGAGRDPSNPTAGKRVKEIEELACVRDVVMIFTRDYLEGPGDGLAGLRSSLDELRSAPWFIDMGTLVRAKLDRFDDLLRSGRRQLADELARSMSGRTIE